MSKQDDDKIAKMRQLCPDLMDLTTDMLLGDIWNRPGLSPRDRSLITVAALISTHRPGQMDHHFRRAVANGITREEFQEIFIHLAFYAGWPAAMAAVDVAMKVFED